MKNHFDKYTIAESEKLQTKKQEAVLMLAAHSPEDKIEKNILSSLGWDDEIKKHQEKINEIAEKENILQSVGSLLTFEKAEEIAKELDCVIGLYSDYVGPLDKNLLKAISEICTDQNETIDQLLSHSNIYIIAPICYFKGFSKNNAPKSGTITLPCSILYTGTDRRKYSKSYFKVYGELGNPSNMEKLYMKWLKFIFYTPITYNAVAVTTIGILPIVLTTVLYFLFNIFTNNYSVNTPQTDFLLSMYKPTIYILASILLIGLFAAVFKTSDLLLLDRYNLKDYNSRTKCYSMGYLRSSFSDHYYPDINMIYVFFNQLIIRTSILMSAMFLVKLLILLFFYTSQGPLTNNPNISLIVDGFSIYMK